jgi:hypothetical protein
MSEDFSEKEKSKASEESERVLSREQEKYRCSIFSERVSKTQSVYFSRV